MVLQELFSDIFRHFPEKLHIFVQQTAVPALYMKGDFSEGGIFVSEAILSAIITGVLSLGGVLISNALSSRRNAEAICTAQAVTDTKLEELTREVREHNHFARRMPVVEEQIKVLNHRVEDLEHSQAHFSA